MMLMKVIILIKIIMNMMLMKMIILIMIMMLLTL